MARSRRALPLPARPTDPDDRDRALDYLNITLSHPRWLVARWYDRYGLSGAEAWERFNNEPARLTLRVNRLKHDVEDVAERLGREGVVTRRGQFAPDALVVEQGQPLRGEGASSGWFVVQDEASQLVALLAGRSPGHRVLDACASPGGKTLELSAAMGGRGLLLACDVRGRRMDLLRRTVTTGGATNVRLVQADLLQPLPFSERFDCVLVDAPCSSLGTLRRDPDIKWRRHEDDLHRLARAQSTMLAHAAEAVGPGGRLVYATCSSEPEENEDVAAAFLASAPHFSAVDAREGDISIPASVIDARGHLRTEPHRHGLEAFFGAAFRRKT